jgi:hypothetical protein
MWETLGCRQSASRCMYWGMDARFTSMSCGARITSRCAVQHAVQHTMNRPCGTFWKLAKEARPLDAVVEVTALAMTAQQKGGTTTEGIRASTHACVV